MRLPRALTSSTLLAKIRALTCGEGGRAKATITYHNIIWVVVKIMVPFWESISKGDIDIDAHVDVDRDS